MYPWLDGFLRALPGAEYNYKPEWQWDRYQVRGKLFAALCTPGPEYKLYGGHPLINLKCDPGRAELYRGEFPEVLPGFYTDKRNWNAVFLDGGLPDDVLREMCLHSYRLVVDKLPKYVRRELGQISEP